MNGELDTIIRNSITEKLLRDEVAVCMSVRILGTPAIAQIAQSAGFHGLYVDLEHSTLGLEQVGNICQAALSVGVAALVRVPEGDESLIPRTLDAGAVGVIIPHIADAKHAGQVAAAARFAPEGNRSVSPTLPQLHYRKWPAAEARAALNRQTLVIAMIESNEGIENIDEIAAVPGIDILFVGTNDLCAQWNLHGQFDHPKVEQAYMAVAAACRKHHKHFGVGGLAARPDLVRKCIANGARFAMAGNDLQFIIDGATAARRGIVSA